ncbi:ribonuclease III [Flavobacterium psychrophilum]|jgi:ribonuclease-3|uniref:Ribonuclease 3 n=2 Tax=Flavobacterium psychrophilum TaxID=96345 RepID=RNC_FLAPJ|nr:ribonuclease III [Flavobacterium psychrophilum]A6GW45.1 RecName: Full=Ribonuclease 3; AltName: Full=Ribonuclease III; Short=RNase III [Flavobacterium psychrophilum JIP02/86]AIG29130.1 ribonuclease III [Flavobacterium psychrophilum]AIG31407.1 ribonuclease III [Flavobacterium psychrophilum]AIG33564.1 ribonuclease III [Flavobacterium psychrophilum]AIG35931.1 ribonuclease III [Flavobacterium psychrophilum]AIG38187.1 ribonuclease III [Flavobacterium psychrophilum]
MSFIKKIFLSSRSSEDGLFFSKLEKILGFKPLNLTHFRRAFTHRSMNKLDEKGNPMNYERLEFMGDAMLGSVIAAHLFNMSPTGDEGYLTKMRSKIVSREHLNELGKDLNLIQFLESKVTLQNFGENIHGNLFEAFVGAIYLDRGFVYCEKFIHKKVIKPYVDIDKLEGKVISYKSLLIEWCQKEKRVFHYDIYEDEDAGKLKYFGVKLSIDGKVVAKARATSKKKAEEIASKRGYFVFQSEIDGK